MISNWNHKLLRSASTFAFATVFGIICTASPMEASAQQRWRFDVKDHASDIQHLARDIRSEVLHDAKGSRQFGPLLAATGRLEGSAAVLRAWAKHQGPLDLRKQLEKVDCAHKDLLRLVSEAKHDLHFHHGGFTCPKLDALLAEVCDHIAHAKGDIPTLHHHHHDVHHGGVTGRPFCGNTFGLHNQRIEVAPGPLSLGTGGSVIHQETVIRSPGRNHTTVKKVYVSGDQFGRQAYVDSRIQDYYRNRSHGNVRHYKKGKHKVHHHKVHHHKVHHHNVHGHNRYGHPRNPYTRKSKGVHLDGGGITIRGRNVGFRINF